MTLASMMMDYNTGYNFVYSSRQNFILRTEILTFLINFLFE